MSSTGTAPVIAPEDELLDVAGVAQVLGLDPGIARRLVTERRVPTIKIGKYVRVRRGALEAYLTANTRPAVATAGSR